jgi:hypothetical protein
MGQVSSPVLGMPAENIAAFLFLPALGLCFLLLIRNRKFVN